MLASSIAMQLHLIIIRFRITAPARMIDHSSAITATPSNRPLSLSPDTLVAYLQAPLEFSQHPCLPSVRRRWKKVLHHREIPLDVHYPQTPYF